jgi:prophage tail gpP-like protein
VSRGGGGGKATPGRTYVTNSDGDVEEIASQAYGDPSQAAIIQSANALKTNRVKKGTLLIIPGNPPPSRLTGKQSDDLTILIDGLEVPMLSARIIRTMDTGADGWTGRFAWTPGENPALDNATRPYGYTRSAAYIGNELMVGGCLYTVEPEMTDDSMTKGLTGYSFTADAIDSHVQPPYEYSNVSLKQLADALLPPLGIKAVFQDQPIGGTFSRVKAAESDSVFAFLAKLATQRSLLVSSTPQGDILFLRARTTGKPVGVLTEDQPMVTGWKARYDGRLRFYAYKCIRAAGYHGTVVAPIISAGGAPTRPGPVTAIEYDPHVPRSRFLTFQADGATAGSIQDIARWKRNRQFVEALTQEYPVSSWYAPDGSLWRENTLVTVVSPTLGVPKGFTFCIRAVEYILEPDRRTAVLSLVPPEAYSGKDIGEVWKL